MPTRQGSAAVRRNQSTNNHVSQYSGPQNRSREILSPCTCGDGFLDCSGSDNAASPHSKRSHLDGNRSLRMLDASGASRQLGNENFVDATAVHVDNLEPPAVHYEYFACLRYASQLFEDQTRQRREGVP